MSWLVSSISSSLNLDDDDDADPKTTNVASSSAGVKEDLSEFSETLTRHFRGVASFLAPPRQFSNRNQPADDSDSNFSVPAGIRNDLSEIGRKFRTGISKLSGSKAVSEFTKIASNLLQFASEEEFSVEVYARRGVVGVTEEVVAFARDAAMHLETWLDFPLHDDVDEEDFNLSDSQQEHALAVEHLVPKLASLKNKLCLRYMSEGSFWKIYFVLVHPRLSRRDADILSTPQIVRARAMLTQELCSHGKSRSSEYRSRCASTDITVFPHEEHVSDPVTNQSDSIPVEISVVEPTSSFEADFEMTKHPVISIEVPIIDKAVVGEVPQKQKDSNTSNSLDQKDEDDPDDWLKEESTKGGSLRGTSYPLGNDDDVSFKDLEIEEDEDVPTSYKIVPQPNSSAKESSDSIQQSNTPAMSAKDVNIVNTDRSRSNKVSAYTFEIKDSKDWLDVDIDVA